MTSLTALLAQPRLREIFLFLVVGGSAALAYMAAGVFFTTVLAVRPSVAVALSLAVVMPPAYLAQKVITFRSAASHRTAFIRYAGVQAISNGVAIVGAELFSTTVRSQPWIAFFTIALIVACLNYALLKAWAFRG